MKRFFKKHQDWILGATAVVLLALLAGFFVWGIRLLAGTLNRAITVEPGSRETVEFRVDEARAFLKVRGLVQ